VQQFNEEQSNDSRVNNLTRLEESRKMRSFSRQNTNKP
jgi:hypothetical protein